MVAGLDERVYIGGLHEELKLAVASALEGIGVEACLDDHAFPAINSDNICNRGVSGRGVQLEFTTGIRRLMKSPLIGTAIRDVLANTINPSIQIG
ncbi:MAG: poly-gamma-glutamate hydrolase family protein [Gammaproteobacteria bacterium]